MTTASQHVLIVEDEHDLAELYTPWLAESYAVETAYGGEEALEKLDEHIDVVLLDRRMPGLSGGEVLEQIRSEGLDVRVAIVSAVSPDFDVIGMGFDDYLVKPVDREEIHATVERMLSRTEYSDTMNEFEQLAATKAVLKAEKSTSELLDNEQYQELEVRMTDLQNQVDSKRDAFDEDDYHAAFRDLDMVNMDEERPRDKERSE